MAVPARLSIVTLGVTDLDRSISFYEALGWERAASSIAGEICWFRLTGSYLGLFGYEALAEDANLPARPRGEFGGITLAINVDSEEAVTAAIEAAATAGATVLKAGTRMEWGGFSGYFADPDGYPWEVAFNPSFPLDAEGRVHIP